MVSLRMMGWGLVLLENSSVAAVAAAVAAVTAAAVTAAAVAAAAVAAAAVAAAAVAVGVDPLKNRFLFEEYKMWTHFQGCVFRKYIVHMFKMLTIYQRGSFERHVDRNLKNAFLVTTFQKRYQEMSTY